MKDIILKMYEIAEYIQGKYNEITESVSFEFPDCENDGIKMTVLFNRNFFKEESYE